MRREIENVVRRASGEIQRVEEGRGGEGKLEVPSIFRVFQYPARSCSKRAPRNRYRNRRFWIDVRAQRGGATWPGIVIMKEYRGKVGRHEPIKSRGEEGEEVCAQPSDEMHAISAVIQRCFPKWERGLVAS